MGVDPAITDEIIDDKLMTKYILWFIEELDRVGHTDTPILFIVSKWDLVKDKYKNVDEFFKDKSPVIWSKINEASRKCSIMKFTIGEVADDNLNYNYVPETSRQLFDWMYETQLEVTRYKDERGPGFGGLIKRIFGKN